MYQLNVHMSVEAGRVAKAAAAHAGLTMREWVERSLVKMAELEEQYRLLQARQGKAAGDEKGAE